MTGTNWAALPVLDKECSRCQGNGVVTTPEWLAWRARELEAEGTWRAANPGGSWYASTECDKIADQQPEDAEMECPDCSGRGAIPTAAGKHLLTFLRRHS